MFDVGNDFGNFVLGNHVQGLREAIPKKSESWDMEGGGRGVSPNGLYVQTYLLVRIARRKKKKKIRFKYVSIHKD